MAADGQGTNILANTSGAKYTFNAKAPAANNPTSTAPATGNQPAPAASSGALPPQPEINSVTHPDQNVWYANNNPELGWKLLPDISAVSFSLDQSSSTDPGKKSDGIIETKTYSLVPDGRNFFHIKFQNKTGWGPVGNRQILIDVTPPTDFTINVATEHDSVYAFDADSTNLFWHVSMLGTNEVTSDDRGCAQVTPEIGITATPVIDRQLGPNGTIFVVAMSKK